MKLRFLTVMCIITCMSNINPVYADNQGTKVSMDTIEKIVLNNSLDLKMADNTLQGKIKYYDELKDDIDKLESAIKTNEDKSKNSEDAEAKDNLQVIIKDDKASLQIKEEEYDKKQNELKKARMTYKSKLKETVINAQNKYVDYINAVAVKQLKEDTFEYNNSQNAILKAKYDMGYSSKNEYNNNFIDVWTAQNDYNQAVSDEVSKEKDLKNSLGVNDEKISVENDINLEMKKIAQINFDNDFKEMITNNMDIKNKKIEVDEWDDKKDKTDSEEFEEDNAELSLKQSKEDAKIAFEKAYNNLIDSYNTLNVDMNKLTKSENDKSIMDIKISFGEKSKREKEKQILDLNNQKNDLVKEKNDLYVNYMKYLQMKEGYSLS